MIGVKWTTTQYKIERKQVGWVVEFCSICQEPRAYLLHEVWAIPYRASDMFWSKASLGQVLSKETERILAYQLACSECQVHVLADSVDSEASSEDRPELGDGHSRFGPETEQAWGAMRERGPVERAGAILTAVSQHLDYHRAQTHLDTRTVISLLLALVGPITLILVLGPTLLAIYLVIGLGSLAIVSFTYFLLSEKGRYVRRSILPMMVRGLKGSGISEADLDEVWSRTDDASVTRYLSPSDVHFALQMAPFSGS